MKLSLENPGLRRFLVQALDEDLGRGDVTSRLTVPAEAQARVLLLAREAGVLAGALLFSEVFRRLEKGARVRWRRRDGQRFKAGAVLATLQGSARALLAGERLALNLLQQLSGVATLTAAYVAEAGRGGPAKVLDTRKTVPGLRVLQKYAVACGGGFNHRMRLDDAVLIKDNHIKAAGSVAAAVKACRRGAARLSIECEVENVAELDEALQAGADIVLLDNFSRQGLRQAVKILRAFNRAKRRKVLSEASGGVNLKNIRGIAATGVDRISVGALTHSARALDLSLEFLPDKHV
jgi:nicotinate-nucleotide pyrophosphorylase (carboxylating)